MFRLSTFDWTLLIKWVIANLIGYVVGFLLLVGIRLLLDGATGPIVLVIEIGMLLAMGAAAGVAQAYVLVNRIRRSDLWATAMAIGLTIGMSGDILLRIDSILSYGIAGILYGILAWLILKKQFKWAHWYIVASAIGWTVGHGNIVTILTTGVVLIWILHHPIQQPDQSTSSM